jgi:hypothetical protein
MKDRAKAARRIMERAAEKTGAKKTPKGSWNMAPAVNRLAKRSGKRSK